MNLGYYTFLAIRGQQGKHLYYLVQCPLRLISRLFLFDESEVPSELRKMRSLDPVRAAEIATYIATQPDSYVLAPLVAVIDRDTAFEPLSEDQSEIGRLIIPLDAKLIIHDGQHRRAAIQHLLAKDATLENDTIPVMLFPDPQLTFSPGLYNSLNQPQMRSTRSRRVLQDHGDLATLVRQLVDEIPLFHGLIELEKTTISNRSMALFTLSAVYQATQALLNVSKKEPLRFDQVATAQQFWEEIGRVIPEWRQVSQRQVTAAYLRQNFVHSHTVTLLAIGMACHDLIQTYPDDWIERLQALGQVDWSRKNTQLWEGRAMVRGRMSKARDSVNLTAIAIKRILGLQLTQAEEELEHRLLVSK